MKSLRGILLYMTFRKILQSATITGFIFGFAGWYYIAQNAVYHPVTLHMPLTHFWKYPHEDTFGAICFAVSIICCFTYFLIRDDRKTRLR
jgi:hypothetical protein